VSDARARLPVSELSGAAILRLARSDRDAARERLRPLDAAALAHACLDLRPEVRPEFLMLVERPEDVVPLLPEAELVSTIRSGGMSEGSWLLEIATPEQRQACFDLDCWDGAEVELERVVEWVDALIEAGSETLADVVDEVDAELWVLLLRSLTEVAVLHRDVVPPPSWVTVDGVVYWGPRGDTDPSRIQQLAQALFDRKPQRYWQLVYAALFESPAECHEWALRWRAGRLADLGFPEIDQAIRAYAPLRPEEAPVWQQGVPGGDSAVVEAPRLPRQLRATLLGDALARLDPARAADVLGYVLGVSNALAVADRLRLSEAESIPRALEKAVRGIDLGLRELSKVRQQSAEEVLDRVAPMELFRVGATLDPTLRQR
jgi:hypothetical protein